MAQVQIKKIKYEEAGWVARLGLENHKGVTEGVGTVFCDHSFDVPDNLEVIEATFAADEGYILRVRFFAGGAVVLSIGGDIQEIAGR